MRHPLRLALVLPAFAAVTCGAPTQEIKPPTTEEPAKLDPSADLHVLAAWSEDTILYGQAAKIPPPTGREPWPKLLRVPLRDGTPETVAESVFNLVIRRGRGDTKALAVYQTPVVPGTQTLRSIGHLYVLRPGEAPTEITPADPPFVVQPLYLSPDNRYLLSYGTGPDPAFWSLDLTDLQTMTSRRLGFALSVTPPSWIGFEGGNRRFVTFANVEGYRPVAAYRLEDNSQPLVLPGRVAGLLADGRAVTEGDDIRAVVLERNGAQTVLAKAPVVFYSTFVRGGAAYYIAAAMGQVGPLVRLDGVGAPTTVAAAASYLWYAPPGGTVAYFADLPTDGGLNASALLLPDGPNLNLSADPLAAYRPARGDGVFFFQTGNKGALYFNPTLQRPVVFATPLISAWQVSDRHVALVATATAGDATGQLLLAGLDGKSGPVLAEGVDLLDSVDRDGAGVLVYSVPKGAEAGLWRRPFP